MTIDPRTLDYLTNDVIAMVLARANGDEPRARALVDGLTIPERKLLPEILWLLCCVLVRAGDQSHNINPRRILETMLITGLDEPIIRLTNDNEGEPHP